MQEYQARVIVERDELSDKLQRLYTFILSPKFNDLEVDEKLRMSCQYAYMKSYYEILKLRILFFKES